MIPMKPSLGFLPVFIFLFGRELVQVPAEEPCMTLAGAGGWHWKRKISAPQMVGQPCGDEKGLAVFWPCLGAAEVAAPVSGELCWLQGVTVAPLPPQAAAVDVQGSTALTFSNQTE